LPADEGSVRIVSHTDLTPRWQIYRAQTAGFMRWTQNYTLGPNDVNDFPDDPVVVGAQVHVKLFSLLPNNIQPPHMHEEDIIFAVVAGTARFLDGPEGRPIGIAGPLDVVYVPAGKFYGSINPGPDLFQAYVIRLPRDKPFKASYNVNFPAAGAKREPEIRVT
jgi:mannose-6-phosphate isomerase-like protein (cupin superfamily)